MLHNRNPHQQGRARVAGSNVLNMGMNLMRFILFKMSYSPDRGGAGVLYWNADSEEENTTSRNVQVLLNLKRCLGLSQKCRWE